MNIVWWYFWHSVKIDVFQLHRAMVYNKIYIAVLMAEIMMKLNGSLQSKQPHHFQMSFHLTWKISNVHYLRLFTLDYAYFLKGFITVVINKSY